MPPPTRSVHSRQTSPSRRPETPRSVSASAARGSPHPGNRRTHRPRPPPPPPCGVPPAAGGAAPPPRPPLSRDDAAEPDAEDTAERHADRIHADRERPAPPPVVLRDDRLRRGTVARFPKPDQRPAGEQLPELSDKSAGRRRCTPDRH